MLNMLSAHGEYPFDSIHIGGQSVCPWKRVRRLTPTEAADLLELPADQRRPNRHGPDQEDELEGGPHMLNKGFIVIRLKKLQGPSVMNLAMWTMLGARLLPKDIQVGDQAVYQHDFSFWLIEFVGGLEPETLQYKVKT